MTRGELIVLNRRLAEFGERFCPDCEGVFPLDEEHWYWRCSGKARKKRPSDRCKRCYSVRRSLKRNEAYRTDPELRARIRLYRQSVMADPVKHERKKASARKYMRRKRREALEVILRKGVGEWQQ